MYLRAHPHPGWGSVTHHPTAIDANRTFRTRVSDAGAPIPCHLLWLDRTGLVGLIPIEVEDPRGVVLALRS